MESLKLDFIGRAQVNGFSIVTVISRGTVAAEISASANSGLLNLPVTGDWNGAGRSKIGVFRPRTGEWLLDLNGNNQWDDCGIDLCLTDFGDVGDIPVAGKWR